MCKRRNFFCIITDCFLNHLTQQVVFNIKTGTQCKNRIPFAISIQFYKYLSNNTTILTSAKTKIPIKN